MANLKPGTEVDFVIANNLIQFGYATDNLFDQIRFNIPFQLIAKLLCLKLRNKVNERKPAA